MTRTFIVRFRTMFMLALASLAAAQNGNNPSVNSLTFPVFSLNPAPVAGASISIVGASGQATWYFWASANYQLGSVISPIGSVVNAPNTLTSGNYISIIPDSYPAGVLHARHSGDDWSAGSGRCVQLRGRNRADFGRDQLPIEFAFVVHRLYPESAGVQSAADQRSHGHGGNFLAAAECAHGSAGVQFIDGMRHGWAGRFSHTITV